MKTHIYSLTNKNMPFSKHDSNAVLEILSAFAVVALLVISIVLYLGIGELKIQNKLLVDQNKLIAITASDKSEKSDVAATESGLTPETEQAIVNRFTQSEQILSQQYQGLQLSNFYLQKVLEKQFTAEELEALGTEYQEIQAAIAAQQQAAANQSATPANTDPAPAAAPAAQ